VDGAAPHQPGHQSDRRAGAARSDAGALRRGAGPKGGGSIVSREDEVRRRMSDDHVIVGAMADASREIAGADAGPGPTPAVWHRLQGRMQVGRARSSRPAWRGLLLAGASVAAVF